MRKSSIWVIAALVLTFSLLMGCDSGAQTPSTTKAKKKTTTKKRVEFDSTAAEEESYWYSRYNLGSLVMRSGLGDVFKPDKAVMGQAMKMVDADFNPNQKGTDYGDKDHPQAPKNPALLQSVYKSGDPHFTTKFDNNDFKTQRWDPASFDKSMTGLALGFTMIKETEWAKQFHVDDHFGTPKDDFGAQWRFLGMILNLEAKMQAKNFLSNQAKYDLKDGGNYVMLWALSDQGGMLAADNLHHSASNRYKDPQTSAMLLAAADKMFNNLQGQNPTTIKEQSLAIQALVWYAANTTNTANKKAALQKIKAIADQLAARQDVLTNDVKIIGVNLKAKDRAYAIRGLIEAQRVLGIDIPALTTITDKFLSDFSKSDGIFKGQDTYTTDDVAEIIGALNAIKLFGGQDLDTGLAEDVFTQFFKAVLDKAPMQQSAPPLDANKSPFEREGEPDIYFRYPDLPVPPKAGGKYGIAPVYAGEVTFKDGSLKVSDRKFDAAGAMHAANEMIWLHYDEIVGFPTVNYSDVVSR